MLVASWIQLNNSYVVEMTDTKQLMTARVHVSVCLRLVVFHFVLGQCSDMSHVRAYKDIPCLT